jgi:PKD repeat protein
MNKIYFFLLSFLFSVSLSAQSFDGPESVEYDALYNRWLVGNTVNGTVVAYSPGVGTTPFCSGMASGPYGIETLDSVLYCCDGSRVKGYHLATGVEVFNVNLGATFLNGITSDGVSNLFITDFSAKKIYRLNTVTGNFNVMVTGLVKSPNGIIYDAPNNRCVFVNWGTSAPIMAMSIADSSTSTLITTSLSNIDGISRDLAGNWYVSTWGGNALRKFDPAFASAPVSVMTGLSSPADLGINTAGDSIGIPNSGSANNVVFYRICTATTLVAGFTSNANGPIVQFTNATTGGTPTAYSWDFGDGATATTASPSHTYAGAGTFTVCLIVIDACGSDTICDSVTVTATAMDVPQQYQFGCYPNPAHNQFTAESAYPGEITLRMINLNGQLVSETRLSPGTKKVISLSGFAPGIYLTEWRNESGEILSNGKLIVE